MQLDHLMWGAPELESGIDEIEKLLGVRAIVGGAHPGQGTCNALLAFNDGAYLEIIAPDPSLPEPVSFGARLAQLTRGGLVTWVLRNDGLDALGRRFEDQHLRVRGPREMSRTTPDGVQLNWALLFVKDHPFENLLPFFIDWKGSAHPSGSSPLCGSLTELQVRTAGASQLGDLLEGVEARVRFEASDSDCLVATIEIPAQEATGKDVPGRRVALRSTGDTILLQL